MINLARKTHMVLHKDCRRFCRQLRSNMIDTIITDPPYGLKFMGKEWDHGVPGVEFWGAFKRVCKPGAMLLAFGGTRTFHRLACAIEDAGWELKDCLMWVYGSGFPKSHNISKAIDKAAGVEREVVGERNQRFGLTQAAGWNQTSTPRNSTINETTPATEAAKLWDGWGSGLKPAWEPVLLAMKPLEGTFAENAIKHGVAGLAIDQCRVGMSERPLLQNVGRGDGMIYGKGKEGSKAIGTTIQGRFPANLIHDGSEEVLVGFPESDHARGNKQVENQGSTEGQVVYGKYAKRTVLPNAGDSGSAARFFYCAKSSKRERNDGLPEGTQNNHPTVKPLALMEYLCKLTATPTGGIVFDPFMGSGSTGVACAKVGRRFVGCDNDLESCRIAFRRVGNAYRKAKDGSSK